MDRGAWQAMVHRVTKCQNMTEATEHASILGSRDRDEKLSPCSHGADGFIEIDNLGVGIIHS